MRALSFAAAAALLLSWSTAATAQPKPPPELAVFSPVFGAWKLQESFEEKAGPRPGNSGDARFRWGPGRMFVIQELRTTGPNGVQEGMCVYGYDAATKRYVAQWYASHRPEPEPLEGSLRDGRLVFEGQVKGPNGAPAFLRLTLGPLEAKRFQARFELGPTAKQLERRWTTTYTRPQ